MERRCTESGPPSYTGAHVDQSKLLKEIVALLDQAAEGGRPDDITLRHCLNERWFSDTLSWLVDPRGDHGLGVAFLREFTKEVARERCRKDRGYARRASHLKWSRAPGPGRNATGLSLGNAGTFREFYLAGGVSRKNRGDRYCDVVVLDLDRFDGLVLVVENKLFGTNSHGQLRDQVEAVEDKYSRAAVREYVYLTLFGEPPSSSVDDEVPILPRWVALSWTSGVLDILERLEPRPRDRLEELVVLLRWLRRLRSFAVAKDAAVRELVRGMLDGGVECLLLELNRLCRSGSWERSSKGQKLTCRPSVRRVAPITPRHEMSR